MLRPKKVAEILDCDEDHVTNLIRKKRLPATNIGTGSQRKEWRVSEEDLSDFLKQNYSIKKERIAKKRRKLDGPDYFKNH